MDPAELQELATAGRDLYVHFTITLGSGANHPRNWKPSFQGMESDLRLELRFSPGPIPVFHPRGVCSSRLGPPDHAFR